MNKHENKNKITGIADALPTKRTYINPILPGFYPDPSICRVQDDYYLVASSFSYYPGLPLFHSKDLIHWRQIGHALDRPSQLNLDNLELSQGCFAPAIHYNEGTFYITNTLVGGGGNFITTAKNPEGPWSDPDWILHTPGIDPSLFFDDNGKVYWVSNGNPPRSRYDGHKVIWMQEIDLKGMKLVLDTKQILVDGGSNPDKNPIWIEAPHLFKKDSYYYLIAAEGGTFKNHSEVVFRSNTITGPYESFKDNPILTQHHLPPGRKNAITCTGHADFVETQTGEWWAVFLGCRPYEPCKKIHYNTGRETFLAPIKWIDGWPVINPEYEKVQYFSMAPDLPEHKWKDTIPNGNFTMRDDFDSKKLADYWIFIRTPREKWYSLSEKKGHLRINLRPAEIILKENPGFIGRRQQHTCFKAETALLFTPKAENETAGIAVFQNETHFYYLGVTLSKGRQVLCLVKGIKAGPTDRIHNEKGELVAAMNCGGPEYTSEDGTTYVSDKIYLLKEKNLDNKVTIEETTLNNRLAHTPLYLRIKAKGKLIGFYYSEDQKTWKVLRENVDNSHLSTKTAGGFVGVVIGMYASSQGKPSSNYADFDWFEYSGEDAVYDQLR